MFDQSLDRAAEAIAAAGALLIGAGAGMGVDSGLPDFRGAQGFWRAYPPYERLGLDFESLANPHRLERPWRCLYVESVTIRFAPDR
jgi:NAD-dependent SIR2 family protein deacetylase